MEYLDYLECECDFSYERQSQEAELHAETIAENARESVYCRFTGRKLGEIGLKPRGFDPESLPDFEAGKEISQAISDDTKDALHLMRLCGRGISRSSADLWDGED
jgi:hypothetical protein